MAAAATPDALADAVALKMQLAAADPAAAEVNSKS
jgi:hypothetical protein